MDEFQYRRKKQEVLEKFPPEFRDLIKDDNLSNQVFKALVNGTDVYRLLFDVIKSHADISKKLHQQIVFGPPPQYFVGTQEMINKLKKDNGERL